MQYLKYYGTPTAARTLNRHFRRVLHFLLCYRGINGTHGGSRTHKETCVLSAAHMPILLRGYITRLACYHTLIRYPTGIEPAFQPIGAQGRIRTHRPLRVHLISSQRRYNHFGTCAYLFNWCERYGHYPYLTLRDTCAPNLLRVPQLQCGRL